MLDVIAKMICQMLSDMQHKPPAQFRMDVLVGVVALQWLLSRPLLHFNMGNSNLLTQGVGSCRSCPGMCAGVGPEGGGECCGTV